MTDLGGHVASWREQIPFWIATLIGDFAQAKTFKRYKVRRELVNAPDEEARRKIGEEKQKQIEE
jgi:hypothetical protein